MILHRYVGVAIGALMLLWCLSGVVMLFVHYPEVGETERTAALAPINWTRCCSFDDGLSGAEPVKAASVEDLGGAPVLRLQLANGPPRIFDLATGQPLTEIAPGLAASVARQFGRAAVAKVTPVVRDQWTVTGYFNKERPFWRVRMADGRGTDVYVSQRSGRVVQRTTAASRVLNWFGAIPHWLYPAVLRQDVKLWTQVVIWTSLLGTFLTVTGLYLGVVAWRPFRDHRLSPFRGLMNWHHLTGLVAGVLTLTWVVSGLFSMNPWGLLESGDDPAAEQLAGPPPTFADVRDAIVNVAARAPAAGHLHLAPVAGKPFLVGAGTRFDGAGNPARLQPADLHALGLSLGKVASQGPITDGDAYYFSHHETVRLPAWRVVRADGTRVYLDRDSGEVLATVDASGRGYRWLHLGLHRFDFVPGFDRGAGWAAAMVVLLAAASISVGTGVWLAWRRVAHDLKRAARPSR